MTSKLLRWHTGTSTTFSLELPRRDGEDGLADLSVYTGWTVQILDGTATVIWTASDGVAGAVISGTLAGLLTVVPGAAGRTAMEGLDPHRLDVVAIGTTVAGEHHKWSARLLIDDVLD